MKLSKTYEPQLYESDIYRLWEEAKAFAPKKSDKYYSVIMPPPNANANLHIGHELGHAIQDIAVRYHRLKGDSTLYVPGADHAGFETWVVYEKNLNKQGKTRFDFSREELYSQVWEFVQQNKNNFNKQLRAMGVSSDWDKFTFTLDNKVVNQAYSTFKSMWKDKLIYRGERLVNYCTYHGTSFSDIEVVYKKHKGKLWFIEYPLTTGEGSIIIATTRPETMLGDTAVAVHPKDKRYKDYIGKTVKLPLTHREIPIISDDMVDMDFGSGAVKITPAHDPNDFDVAQRHNLPMISIIDTSGRMSNLVPDAYRNLAVETARNKIVKDLEKEGRIVETKTIDHNVGHCYKCGTVIEPLLRDQWFVNIKPLAKKAIEVIKKDAIEFFPRSKKEQAITYLENIKDWNISRQIAWGIPIPAFQNVDDPNDWIFDDRVTEEILTFGDKTYHRDPDVFDTWFSSSQWPYIVLNYPDSDLYKDFYPTSLLDTGGEIFYQWVCRMIMLGLYITKNVPFSSVYIHGYVLAEDGSKMSKSLGNVVDPLPVIESFGSDALRIGIILGRVAGVNQGFDNRKVEQGRNFCNKLWNVARYIEGNIENLNINIKPEPKTNADHWIISALNSCITKTDNYLENYRFSEAFETIYHFIWDDFADWYIEASKVATNASVLTYILTCTLKLSHPFAPFLTETIWQTISQKTDLLITSSWPVPVPSDEAAANEFNKIKELINEIRFIRATLNLSSKLTLNTTEIIAKEDSSIIEHLTNTNLTNTTGKGVKLTNSGLNVWINLKESQINKLVSILNNKIKDQENAIKKLKGRLENRSYVANAPENIVNETRNQLKQAEISLDVIKIELQKFKHK